MKWDKQTQRALELSHIKSMSIIDYLAGQGIFAEKLTKSMKGTIAWYLSPLPARTEKTASFAVYTRKNDFYDFGSGKGGSIIDLAMLLHNIPYTEAVKRLRNKLYGYAA